MKSYLLFSALLCSQVHAAGEGFVNFIRQTQQSTGVVWAMPVTPQGAAPSQFSLETNGALFQLWTIEQTTAKEYLLDQKLVGAYLPSSSVTIKTLDPYSPVPRTRADQPFTVTVNVAGLLAGVGLPAAATKVLLERHLAPYPSGQTSISAAQAISSTPIESAYLTQNGNTPLNFTGTRLKAVDPAKTVSGEEHFVVHALSDGTLTQTQLATAKVQIWPVTSGTIQGIQADQRIRFHAPVITATYTDVYPGSEVWMQVYEGPEKIGTEGTRIVGGGRNNTNAKSETYVLPISNYDGVFKNDGTYTIELLSLTPFGLERLDHVTFSIDRTLEVRGLLGTFENR